MSSEPSDQRAQQHAPTQPLSPEQAAARVLAVFDRAAATYEAVGVPWFDPIARRLVEEMAPVPGQVVLDVGTGRGAVLRAAARSVGPTGSVLGIDISPAMVAATAAELAAEGPAHARVAVADATDPGVAPASVDLVLASLVLFFLPDPPAALRAWWAALRPGGAVGVTTFGARDAAWLDVDAVFSPHLPPGRLDARTSGASGPFADDAGVEQLLADAGFGEVSTVGFEAAVRFADAEQWRTWTLSHGQRQMWEAVPPELRDEVYAEAARRLEQAREGDQLVLRQRIRITRGRRP